MGILALFSTIALAEPSILHLCFRRINKMGSSPSDQDIVVAVGMVLRILDVGDGLEVSNSGHICSNLMV